MYIALLHAPHFLKAPLAACAPRNDRDFWVNLTEYKKCFDANSIQQKMLTAVQESVKNHLWYLTQELVVFGFFDDGLPPNERQTMGTTLLTYPLPNNFPPGKPYFLVELMVADPSLDLFIGERSWLFFDKFQADGQWLHKNAVEWDINDTYTKMKKCIMDLKVVNDTAERCIKDIQEYANLAKYSQYQEDILLVRTDHRGGGGGISGFKKASTAIRK